MGRTKFVLDEKEMPTRWYNIQADLPELLSPVLHSGTKKPAAPADLAPVVCHEIDKTGGFCGKVD